MFSQPLASKRTLAGVAALAAALSLPACKINVKDAENGQSKKVDIETPVGGIHVGENADARDTGLPVYPGAQVKKREGNDNSNASVNISSGLFGLKVAAVEFTSGDSQEKIAAFYRDKLKQYGTILECHTDGKKDPSDVHVNIDDKNKKSHELKCDGGNGNALELKVGTEENQHIVSIRPKDGGAAGSDFALVYVQVHTGDKDKDTI
jgi:hypothetical protein